MVRCIFWQITHQVDFENFMGHCIARHIEPLPAAVNMHPALQVNTPGVLPVVKVVGPLVIAYLFRLFGPLDVRLTTELEFNLVSQAAIGAFNSQHLLTPNLLVFTTHTKTTALSK